MLVVISTPHSNIDILVLFYRVNLPEYTPFQATEDGGCWGQILIKHLGPFWLTILQNVHKLFLHFFSIFSSIWM